jgi:hypothetical protein
MYAFLALSSSPGYEVKELAIGLAAGIIVPGALPVRRSRSSRVGKLKAIAGHALGLEHAVSVYLAGD